MSIKSGLSHCVSSNSSVNTEKSKDLFRLSTLALISFLGMCALSIANASNWNTSDFEHTNKAKSVDFSNTVIAADGDKATDYGDIDDDEKRAVEIPNNLIADQNADDDKAKDYGDIGEDDSHASQKTYKITA